MNIFTTFLWFGLLTFQCSAWNDKSNFEKVRSFSGLFFLKSKMETDFKVLISSKFISIRTSVYKKEFTVYIDRGSEEAFILEMKTNECLKVGLEEDIRPISPLSRVASLFQGFFKLIKIFRPNFNDKPQTASKTTLVRGIKSNVYEVSRDGNNGFIFLPIEGDGLLVRVRFISPSNGLIGQYELMQVQRSDSVFDDESENHQLLKAQLRMSPFCGVLGVQSTANHIPAFQRFRSRIEVQKDKKDKFLMDLQADLELDILSVRYHQMKYWRFEDRQEQIYIDKMIGSSCKGSHSLTKPDKDLQIMSKVIQALKKVSEYRFSGPDMVRGHECEMYELVTKAENGDIVQSIVCLNKAFVQAQPVYAPLMITENIFTKQQTSGQNLKESWTVIMFEYKNLDPLDVEYREGFDISDCVDELLDTASLTLLFKMDSSANQDLDFFFQNHDQIERKLIKNVLDQSNLPSYSIQKSRLEVQKNHCLFSFNLVVKNNLEDYVQKVSDSDIYPYMLRNPLITKKYFECASFYVQKQSEYKITTEGGCEFKYTLDEMNLGVHFKPIKSSIDGFRNKYIAIEKIMTITDKPSQVKLDDKILTIQNILLDDYRPDDPSLPYLVMKKMAEFKPEEVQHILIDGTQGVQVTSFNQCQRECSLASQKITFSATKEKNSDFSCTSFTFCHSAFGQPASCQLSNRILLNMTETELESKIQTNRRCNVFQVNPIAQFHVSRDVKWVKKDAKSNILIETQSSEQLCALRCLSLVTCRSFTAEFDVIADETIEPQVTCEYFSIYNQYHSDLDSVIHYKTAARSNIYSKNVIQDFEQLASLSEKKFYWAWKTISSTIPATKEKCAAECLNFEDDCTGFQFCFDTLIGDYHQAGNCFLQVSNPSKHFTLNQDFTHKHGECIEFKRHFTQTTSSSSNLNLKTTTSPLQSSQDDISFRTLSIFTAFCLLMGCLTSAFGMRTVHSWKKRNENDPEIRVAFKNEMESEFSLHSQPPDE